VDSSIKRFKARLVRGFSQILGVNYGETFAPTIYIDTPWAFLAIVASEDLEYYQFNIRNVFTESKLQKTIYLSVLQGVTVKPLAIEQPCQVRFLIIGWKLFCGKMQ
jgi:hypothetical protein